MTTFETLAVNALNDNSRKIAHRATRPQLFVTGSDNLEIARKAVTDLQASYHTRSEAYIGHVHKLKELQTQLAKLELDAEFDVDGKGEEIATIKAEVNQIEQAIKSWHGIEPELSERIQQAKARFSAFDENRKLAEIDQLLDAEKQAAIEIFSAYESLFAMALSLQSLVNQKRKLQAELNTSRDGISFVELPKISTYGEGPTRAATVISAAKESLLVG